MNLDEVAVYCAKSWAVGTEEEGREFTPAEARRYLAVNSGLPVSAWEGPLPSNTVYAPVPDTEYACEDLNNEPIRGVGLCLVAPYQLWVVCSNGLWLTHWRFTAVPGEASEGRA